MMSKLTGTIFIAVVLLTGVTTFAEGKKYNCVYNKTLKFFMAGVQGVELKDDSLELTFSLGNYSSAPFTFKEAKNIAINEDSIDKAEIVLVVKADKEMKKAISVNLLDSDKKAGKENPISKHANSKGAKYYPVTTEWGEIRIPLNVFQKKGKYWDDGSKYRPFNFSRLFAILLKTSPARQKAEKEGTIKIMVKEIYIEVAE